MDLYPGSSNWLERIACLYPLPVYTVLKNLPKRRQRLINPHFLSIDCEEEKQ
jgi:hypothetical protein